MFIETSKYRNRVEFHPYQIHPRRKAERIPVIPVESGKAKPGEYHSESVEQHQFDIFDRSLAAAVRRR
ncbi:hypothetical protein L1887_13569 [Cichorium endivia]|nr:hypothetical protein L1887_13569 [Cichorium endivia]